jgi:hypothetical protein
MDQVKEYLKIAIKYRFWIIVGIAAILPLVGYVVEAGAIEKKTTEKTGAIKTADQGVKGFQNGNLPVPRWTELTQQKTQVLTEDVTKSWHKLYERQAPLLDWPKDVEANFKAWGDAWPKDVDANKIQLEIMTYTQVYEPYVDAVYKSFHPWDPETGEGIVVAPPKEILLRPAIFDSTHPPTLGKVHVAQKRLWIQRTLLDVIRGVNEKAGAKDWDTAWIKKISGLEVASAIAQDQKSAAKGEPLESPPEPTNPSAPAAPTTAAAPASGGGGGGQPGDASSYAGMGPRGGRQAGGIDAFGSGSGGAGSTTAPETVEFIKSPAPQFDIVPVMLAVHIYQDHIPDLLIEFENSPMAIQVVDVDWQRPMTRVTKPVKGQTQDMFTDFGQTGGRGGMREMMMMGPGMGGGAASRYQQQLQGMMQGYGAGGGRRGMTGGMMGGSGGTPQPKGKDHRQEVIEKEKAKKTAKKDGDTKKSTEPANTIADPFYNIVEVHIYGQARFYKRPPDEPAPAASPGATPPATEPAKDQAAPGAETKKDETKTEEPKKDDNAKTDEPKTDEAKKDAAETKKDEPKAAESKDAPKAEAKPEDAKPDAPKTEEPKKGEPAKESPKTESPKDQPKAKEDAPKR